MVLLHKSPRFPERHALVVTLLADEYVLVEQPVRRLHAQVRQTRSLREVATARVHRDLAHLQSDLDRVSAGVVALLHAEATVDFRALRDRVLDDALDELRSALVVELAAADHDRGDPVVVEPLHVVVNMRLCVKEEGSEDREAHKPLHVLIGPSHIAMLAVSLTHVVQIWR